MLFLVQFALCSVSPSVIDGSSLFALESMEKKGWVLVRMSEQWKMVY